MIGVNNSRGTRGVSVADGATALIVMLEGRRRGERERTKWINYIFGGNQCKFRVTIIQSECG